MSVQNLHVTNWATQEGKKGEIYYPLCCMTCPQVSIFVAYYVKSISGMNASLFQALFDLRRHNFYVLHLKVN